MRTAKLSIAAAMTILWASAAFAVSPGADSPTAEGGKGAEQHDRSAAPDKAAGSDASGGTSSSGASSASGATFTHGESKRCESLTGAEKDQCDKEEATKTQGEPAQDASKKPADAAK